MPDARPPFRADHVGSLLRPASLKALRAEKDAGRATAEAVTAAENAAIRDAVAFQEGVGLQGITDGEMRRKSWHMDFLMQFSGLTSEGKALPVTFHGNSGELFFTRPDLAVTSRVTRSRPIFVDGFTFLRSVVHRTAKLTLPSPRCCSPRWGSPTSTATCIRTSTASPTTPPPRIAPRSPTSMPPAAAISSSTT